MRSLLSRVRRSDYHSHPFPHIIIADAIDPKICDELIESYPDISLFSDASYVRSNARYNILYSQILSNQTIPKIWRDVLSEQVTPNFFEQFLAIFEPSIREYYPQFWQKNISDKKYSVGIRKIDSFKNKTVLLDSIIGLNTPVFGEATSVRIPHLDNTDKLYSGLFYLRHPKDDSKGGNLELYTYNKKNIKNSHFQKGNHLNFESVILRKTIEYQKNILVLFLNSIDSLHGVSVRNITPWPRYFINLVAEVSSPLFEAKIDPDRYKGIAGSDFFLRGKNLIKNFGFSKSEF